MHLFRPLQIGKAHIPNRIAMTSLPSGLAQPGGIATPAQAAYYADRARGGVGMIIFEAAWPIASDTAQPHLGLGTTAHAEALEGCVAAVHASGSVAVVMLDQPIDITGVSVASLGDLCYAWVEAAGRARAAGADGVMLSCADGGPFHQLVSPLRNQRADQYGGPIDRRLRLLLETIERINRRVGAQLLIGLKLDADEFVPRGLTLQDARVIARRTSIAGVDLVEVTANASSEQQVAQFPGWRVPLAEGIRAVVDVPVMVGGLMADAELADSVIRDRSADLVSLGESLRMDPRWPEHARAMLEESPDSPHVDAM